MRLLSTSALAFAVSFAAGAALAQQRQGGPMQNMQGMDHSNMQGMDHSNMPGMDHSRMNAPGGQGATQGPGTAQGGQKRQPAQPGAQQRRSD